jgi:hypothetical protein
MIGVWTTYPARIRLGEAGYVSDMDTYPILHGYVFNKYPLKNNYMNIGYWG